jgi:hypothetical protein
VKIDVIVILTQSVCAYCCCCRPTAVVLLIPDFRIRPGHIALARNTALQTGCGPLSLARVRLLRNSTAQRAAPATYKPLLCRLSTANRTAVAGGSSTTAARKQQQRKAELTVAAVRTALQQLVLSSQRCSSSVSSSAEHKQHGTTVKEISSDSVSNGHPLNATQSNGASNGVSNASADDTVNAVRGTLLLANGAVITLELPAIASTATAGASTTTGAAAGAAASADCTTVRVDFTVQLVSTATTAAAGASSATSSATTAATTTAAAAAAASASKSAVGLDPPLYMLLGTDSSVDTLFSDVQLGVDAEWSTGLSSCVSLWTTFEAGPTCAQLGGVQEALRTGAYCYTTQLMRLASDTLYVSWRQLSTAHIHVDLT